MAQAIRDGVIEASINHEKGFVQSKETMDIYGTREPQLAFHQRISFCLDIHNMSVKVSAPEHTHTSHTHGTQGRHKNVKSRKLRPQTALHHHNAASSVTSCRQGSDWRPFCQICGSSFFLLLLLLLTLKQIEDKEVEEQDPGVCSVTRRQI